jgi:predicted secreted protein
MASIIPGNPGTIAGKMIGITVGGIFISCETSCDFNCEVEMLPASAVTSGRWKEFIPGIRSWTMSVNMNLLLASAGSDAKTLLKAVLTGEMLALEFRTRSSISPFLIISGNAFVQSQGISAANAGKATSTVTFQGSGPFITNFEEFYLIINAMPIEADYEIIIDTTE